MKMINSRWVPVLLLCAMVVGLFLLSLYDRRKKIGLGSDLEIEMAAASKEEESLIISGVHYDGYEKYAYIQEAFKRGQIDISEPPRFPLYSLGHTRKAFAKAKQERASLRIQSVATFTERGPSNIPGRTRAIIVDAADPSERSWYAGAVGGGVWKTEDAGQSWLELTASLPNLSISSLAQSAANPAIIYAGTGEKIFAGLGGGNGNGLLKSTNAGASWEFLESTAGAEFENIGRVIVDPNDENVVLICTTENKYFRFEETGNNIFRSSDGGASWTEVYTSEFVIPQIIADPKDFSIQYAAVYNGSVIKSTDAGATWGENIAIKKNILESGSGLSNLLESPDIGRVELAIAPNNTNIIYASLDTDASNLYLSLDGGLTWNEAVHDGAQRDIDWLGGQGGWDNTVMVSPLNDSVVYMGGVGIESFKMGSTVSADQVQTISLDLQNTEEVVEIFNVFADEGTDISIDEFVSVEIRFGLVQKAHRFTVPDGSTSGVPAEDHIYQDYVDVPFQVWDTDNDQQLMVSFRDNNANGVFDLNDDFDSSREYIFVNNLAYDPIDFDSNIGLNGGYQYRNSFLLWLVTPEGVSWDEVTLTDVTIGLEIRTDLIGQINGNYTLVANPYEFAQGDYVGPNDLFELHPDHHQLKAINISDNSFQILNTNDGGVWISNSASFPGVTDNSWELVSDGYNTTTYYGADKSPTANRYVAGAQDQGTHVSPVGQEASASTEYNLAFFGDGFEVIWHSTDPSWIIGASQFNGIQRSSNGGFSFSNATTGLEDDGPFVSRLSNSPLEPDILFAIGASGVYRSADFGGNWTYSRIEDERWSFWSAADVEVSLADPTVVWAGGAMTEDDNPGNIFLSQDGGFSFEATNNFGDVGLVTGLYSHPLERGAAFALFGVADGPKVLKTTDLGQTWIDITQFENGESQNGFPDITTYSLLVMPHDTTMIWAGTEIGIVESLDAGATWHLLDAPDFRAVSVWDMKVKGDQVVIATHGRGIWTATIPELLDAESPQLVLAPVLNELSQSLAEFSLVIDIELRELYDEVSILLNDEVVKSLPANAEIGEISELVPIDEAGTYTVRVLAKKDDLMLQSTELEIVVSPISSVVDSYTNDFNEPSDDFTLDLFTISDAPSFISGSLQTVHPYPTQSQRENELNLTTVLNVPIRIAESNATLIFREVVIVETAQGLAPFGEEDLSDFVIIEGSKDQSDWLPLVPAYNSAEYEDWTEAYNLGAEGSGTMYKKRTIDMLDTFEPGDVIQIRFRLYSDRSTNAWGWSIDDLLIQADDVITGFDNGSLASRVNVYPNPSFGNVNLTIENALRGDINVRVIDLAGKQFMNQSLFNQTGKLEQQLDLSQLPFGIYVIELNNGQDLVTKKILKF
ncbi:MAG: T9SS type A sorting domain-containing protein [Cyclobacteriaceae bacterium]